MTTDRIGAASPDRRQGGEAVLGSPSPVSGHRGDNRLIVHSLLYHDIVAPGQPDESGFPGQAAARYKLDWADFERHLDAIAAAGLEASTRVDTLERASERTVVLTFDDGGASAVGAAAALEARGWIGHFFVTTGRIGTAGFLSAAQVRALAAAGHVVGSHSCSHPDRISSLPRERLLAEWTESNLTLKTLTGAPATVAAVPGGYYRRSVARAATASGIRILFTSEPVATSWAVDDCLVLGRYSIRRGMTASTAAALASGARAERLRQLATWNSRKLLKALAGDSYPAVRRALLRRR